MTHAISRLWRRVAERLRLSAGETAMLGALIGLPLGIRGYTFIYAQGPAYISNDPLVCANCHVMQEQYDSWLKSSHRAVAVCNDCHTPGDPVGKYLAKASNGFHHSYAFTTGQYNYPILIKPHNRDVTEHACRKCHTDITLAIEGPHGVSGTLECLRCHDSVGHLH